MVRLSTVLAALLPLVVAGSAIAGSKQIRFKGDLAFVSDAPLEKIEGTAEGLRGTVTTDPDDLTRTRGTLSVAVENLKTGSPIRDRHLKGEDWLDGANHPRLKFEITEVTVDKTARKGAMLVARGTVRGNFTLRGVTAPVSAKLRLKWKGNRVKVKVSLRLKLAAFKVNGQSGVVGKKVGETIEISGVLRGTAGDPQ